MSNSGVSSSDAGASNTSAGSSGGSGDGNDWTPPPSPPHFRISTHPSTSSDSHNWIKLSNQGSNSDRGLLHVQRTVSSLVGDAKRAYHVSLQDKKPGLFCHDKTKGTPSVGTPPLTTLSAVQSVKFLIETIQNVQPGVYNAVSGLAGYIEFVN